MSFVVDTNVLVDYLRRHERATEVFLDALASGRRVTASVMTRVEIRRGTRPHQASVVDALDGFLHWVPVDHEITALASRHAERFGRSHGADAVDYVVAATAERLDADLLTRNVRDFPMFPDLEAPY